VLGLDAIASVIRSTPAPNMEARALWVEAAVAQQLGLKDGQVVKGLVDAQAGAVRLWLKNFSFEVPNGWVLKPGDTPFMRVVRGPSGWALLIQPRADGAPSTGTPAAPTGAASSAPPSAAQLLEARLQAMSARPLDPQALMGLLMAKSPSGAPAWAAFQAWQQAWLAEGMPLAQINPNALKALVQKWLVPNERRLAQGQASVPEPRGLLRRWLEGLMQDAQVEKANWGDKPTRHQLDGLDGHWANTLLAQAKGAFSWQAVLPFTDAQPIHLHIHREAPKQPGDDPPFSVDIHTLHAALGELWLATTIRSTHRVELVMWALQDDTVQWARAHAGLLQAELKGAGLNLESFQIHQAPRPRYAATHPHDVDTLASTVRHRLDTRA
jgi:hypothetical protein